LSNKRSRLSLKPDMWLGSKVCLPDEWKINTDVYVQWLNRAKSLQKEID